MRARAFLAICVMIGAWGLTQAQDKKSPDATPAKGIAAPLDRATLDRRIAKIAHTATFQGAVLWNGGNHEGCFRTYQATLQAVLPLLDHHPKLAAFVDDRLTKADGMLTKGGEIDPIKAAPVLREALDAVVKQTSEALVKKEPPKKPLIERLGGEKAVKALVHDFVAEIVKDPKVNLTRDGKIKIDDKDIEKIEQTAIELLSEGALKYTGPSPTELAMMWAKLKITDEQFKAMVVILITTLKKHKIGNIETNEILGWAGELRPFVVPKD